MAITLVTNVQIAGSVSGATSSAVNTTGATLIVVSVSWYGGATRPTLTDSKGNTWTALTQRTTSIAATVQFYCQSPTVGSGHTFTLSGSGFYGCAQILAFSGTDTTSVVDVQTGATNTGFTISTGSITPTADGALIVSGLSAGDGTAGYSVSGGLTITNSSNHQASVSEGGAAAYLIQTSASAISATWSASTPGSAPSVAATITAFKAASGGGGAGVTLNATPASATASGPASKIIVGRVIQATPATATAAGAKASLARTILAAKASAAASGKPAQIIVGKVLGTSPASAAASGKPATIVRGSGVLNAAPATATANGKAAQIVVGKVVRATPSAASTSGPTATVIASRAGLVLARPATAAASGGAAQIIVWRVIGAAPAIAAASGKPASVITTAQVNVLQPYITVYVWRRVA